MAQFPCALTIAGSDSSGGAGIQADLKTFAAFGVYGASVITAVTAQNTTGVRAVFEMPCDIVAAQLDAVFEDLPIAAIKIGMLASAEIIHIVADRLRANQITTVVLDTVMLSKSGQALLHDDAITALQAELLPLATLVTPNLPEAARLLNLTAIDDPATAAQALLKFGANAVLLKGGHSTGAEVVDMLVTREERSPTRFCHPRIMTLHTHGTGCTLSSAITALLAQGCSLPTAVDRAITWLQHAIMFAWPLGAGQGPVHHFWQEWPKEFESDICR